MGMAEQMKNLSEEILANYKQRAAEFQQRLKDNAELVKEVQKTLDGFRNDHMEMAATIRANAANLRSNLAQEQKDRLKSFQELMTGIQNEVDEIKVSTTGMLKDFSVSHDAMAEKLNKELDEDKANRANWNTGRMKEFGGLMKNINSEIIKIQKEVSDVFGYTDKLLKKFSSDHGKMSAEMKAELAANLTERVKYTQGLLDQYNKSLAEMSKENQKMAKALKADLAKSRKELSQSDIQRMKDFNVTFTGIQKKVQEIQKFVNTFLGEFSTDRQQAAATWAKLAEAIANLGKTPAPVAKKAAPAPVKPVVEEKKKEVVVEEKVKVAEPVAEKPKVVEAPKELTLEEKVLQYINNHKKGVKVADMEEPFGETRMRLGFITKKLLDDGKILKVENAYFPKPKQ
jgi:DNA repair ATPase RecN